MFSFKKLSILTLLAAFLLSIGFSEIYAQKKKTVEQAEYFPLNGRVVDDRSGDAISNAEVHIVDREIKVKTDKEGRFTFEKLRAGIHTLKIDKEGFKKWQKQVRVREGVRVVLMLKPESSK